MGNENEDNVEKAGENLIPLSRLNAKQAKITELEAQLVAAQQQVAAVRAEYAAHQEQAAGAVAFARIGIDDPEAQDLVRYRYSRAPETTRGDFAAWVREKAVSDQHLAHLFRKAQNEVQDASRTPVESGHGRTTLDASQAPPVAPKTNGAVIATGTSGPGRTLRWWMGLSDAEKKAQGLAKEEVARGLMGGWPRG